MDIQEVTDTITVPKGSGVDGFLRTIRKLLGLPRLQEFSVDARGVVKYRHFAPANAQITPVGVDFETLMPSSVIRNAEVEEVPEDPHAATAIARTFKFVSRDLLTPIALVSGVNTHFWDWHTRSTGLPLAKDGDLYGLPFLKDAQIPDHVIIMCAGFGKGVTLIDTVKSYKLLIPSGDQEISPI